MAEDELTLEELDRLDEKRRRKSLRQTTEEVAALLANEKGIRRLLAISDQEWAEAVAEDAGGESGAA